MSEVPMRVAMASTMWLIFSVEVMKLSSLVREELPIFTTIRFARLSSSRSGDCNGPRGAWCSGTMGSPSKGLKGSG